MHESISILHKIQYLDVTKEPEARRSSSGKSVLLTRGRCTAPLPRTCTQCGGPMHIHDRHAVRLQDYELLGSVHIVEVSYHRMRCRRCGSYRSQDIPFRSCHHMVTTRLERRALTRLSCGATAKAASISLGIHPSVVKQIDLRRLESVALLRSPVAAPYIGIDEFLLHKGHRYATAVMDIQRARVIWMQEGKKKEQALNFMRDMGLRWMSQVVAVSMDMNAQYDSAFREMAPHVKIVYDRFHMVKLFNDSVLTTIRRRLQNECAASGDRRGVRLLKGSRFLVLTSASRLEGKDRQAREDNRHLNERYLSRGLSLPPGQRMRRASGQARLRDLLAANSELCVAYVLGDQFRHAYDVDSGGVMAEGLRRWYLLAYQSKVPEIVRFADTIRSNEDGLLNRVAHKISNGVVEGLNNMIKTMRRKAYGFRDTRYFFLKVMFQSLLPKSNYISPKFLL